jgi:hypothetical protein
MKNKQIASCEAHYSLFTKPLFTKKLHIYRRCEEEIICYDKHE